ncbi:MAG: trigger factor [Deltaproteobacteria bacterium]|nr:trigger factor [Deltaproteobacteria bacterium]
MLNYECKVETKGPIVRELTISVKPDSIQEYIAKQLNNLRKTAKIKGFREGKVPLQIIKQYYMQDVKSDVYSKVIRDSYVQALEANKIFAVGMPEIETKSGSSLNDGEPLTFTAKIEIFPDIEVKDISKVKVTRQSPDVTEADIEKSINNIRESHAEVVPNETYSGPAKTDDICEISFKGHVGGEALPELQGENRQIQLGSKSFMEEFEDALIGMKKGDTKTFPINFAADFSEPKLAGKTAEFTVTLHEFKKKQMPELDDEFAKRFKMETSQDLRKKVVETLTEDRARESREKLKESVLGEICGMHKFEVPSGLIRSQVEYLVKENMEYLKRQGFTEKMIREYVEKNTEQLQKRAEEQVRTSLILDKIAEEQKIKVEAKDLELEYTKLSERLNLPPEQVRQLYEKDDNAIRQLRYRIKEDRTIDYVMGQVKVTDAK